MASNKAPRKREYQSVEHFIQNTFPDRRVRERKNPKDIAKHLGLKMADSILKGLQEPRSGKR